MAAELERAAADADDERLILIDIERSINDRLSLQRGAEVVFAPRAQGFKLPLAIAVTGVVLGIISVFVLAAVFGRQAEGYTLVSGVVAQSQDNIIAQLLADSEAQIAQKQREVTEVQNELNGVDTRLAELEGRIRAQVEQLRARLENQSQTVIAAQRERLSAQGLSGAQLEQAMDAFARQQRLQIDNELQGFQGRLEDSVRNERRTLLARREELAASLAQSQRELAMLETQSAEAMSVDPDQMLSSLRQQQQFDQLFISRIDSGYAGVQDYLDRRAYRSARQELDALERFLREDPAVTRIEQLRNRRDTDLRLIERLRDYLQMLESDVALPAEPAERLQQITAVVAMVGHAGGQGAGGSSAAMQYREALRLVPELQEAADAIDQAVRQEIALALSTATAAATPVASGPATSRSVTDEAGNELLQLATALERATAALPGGIGPLAAQLRSLAVRLEPQAERQTAEVVARAQREAADLREAAAVAQRRALEAEQQLSRVRGELSAATERYRVAESEAERLRQDLERVERNHRAAVEGIGSEVGAVERAAALQVELDRLRGEVRNAEARVAQARAEANRLQQRLTAAQAQVAGSEAEAQRLRDELGLVERRLAETREGRLGVEQALAGVSAEVERLRSALARAEAEAAAAGTVLGAESSERVALQQANVRLAELQRLAVERERENQRLNDERRILQDRLGALQREVEEQRRLTADLERRLLTAASVDSGQSAEIAARYQQYSQRIADLTARYQIVLDRVGTLLASGTEANVRSAFELLVSVMADPVSREIFPRLDENLRTIERAIVAQERDRAISETEARLYGELEAATRIAEAERARIVQAQSATATPEDPVRVLNELITEIDQITHRSFLEQPVAPNPRAVGTVTAVDDGNIVLFEMPSGSQANTVQGLQFFRRLPNGERVLVGEGAIIAAAGSSAVGRVARTIAPTVRVRVNDIVYAQF